MRKRILLASAVLLSILALGWGAFGQDPEPEPQGFGEGGPVAGPQESVVVRTFRSQGEWGHRDFAGGRGAWHGLVPGGEERLAARLMAALENDRVKAYLNLSDPQVDRLRQILVDAEKAGVKARADIAVRGIELRELLRADKPDRDTVIRKVQEISDLRGQLMKERIEALLAVKGVLTPEQQKKIRSFIGRRAARQPTGGRMGFGMRREGFGPPRPETTPRAPAPPARPGEPPVQ